MFQQDCFAHELQGACKAAALYCNSEYDKVTIFVCIETAQKNPHNLCYVDQEEFIWFIITNKVPELCCIETTQDVDTYQKIMGIFD